ncbi:MotA/TolQ/ExbB proton channel family protein [bacterium]|nr:MotA/TolQ/ExbB proton channel family protein [bacterium]
MLSEIWSFLVKGGIMMIPLLLSSVLALAVIIERAVVLRRKRILDPEVVILVENAETPAEVETVFNRLEKKNGPFLNILRVCLANRGKDRASIKEAILDAGRQEMRYLERYLAVLETIAGVAPLLGLLGTVLGMMKIFDVIVTSGLGQTQLLSRGISEALITTVVGLFIAIPALVAYNYFTHKVEDFVLEIEKYSSSLMEKLEGKISGRPVRS